ncbi:MAG: 30S ribosomal protein S20 [Chloroflexi bacterium]|nr:30S ribosomal protein S20 [Chloroflexota bacterium]MBU1747928.1 30S ribosomal protein S20 [Chloroflexota bacterium]
MANTKSAIKEIRVSRRRQQRNKPIRSRAKTEVKKVRLLIADGDLDAAREQVQVAVQALDRATSKGVIHRNNAARYKSRLMKRLNQALAQANAN